MDAERDSCCRGHVKPAEPAPLVLAEIGRRAAIVDSRSVKTSGNVPEPSQGIDAGKRIKGRKRHIATDVLGLLLVL
jgi:hypothetical protein